MAYRAGGAFIQVVPSFRGFQTKAAAEAKKLRAIKIPVEYEVSDKPLVIPPAKAPTVKVKSELDSGSFERNVREKLRAALKALPTAEIGVATTAAGQKIKDLRAELTSLADKRIGVDLSAEAALGEVRRLEAELTRLGAESPNIQVRADAAAAVGELSAVREMADRLGHERPTVTADADTAAASTKLRLLDAQARGMSGRRILMTVAIAAAPMLGPLAAVGAGALGGLGAVGAGAIGGAAGFAALGTAQLKTALDIQKKLTQATKNRTTAANSLRSAEAGEASAAMSTGRAQMSSARAIADAERGVGRAETDAARADQVAHRQIVAAQEQLVASQERVRSSLESLHAAREQAKRDLQDLKERTRDNALNSEAADIALIEAKQRLAQVEASEASSSLDLRKARLDVAEAENQVSDVRRQSARDASDLKKAEKPGGSDQVRAARQQVADARRQAADARRSVRQAKTDAAATHQQGLQQVADAERAVTRAQQDAAAQASADAAQMAEARARVAAAQKSVNAATVTQQNLLDRLSPTQKRALAEVAALKTAWTGFLHATDGPILGAMAVGMHAVEKSLPALARFIKPVARGFRDVFSAIGDKAGSKRFSDFSALVGRFSGKIVRDAGKGTINLAIGFGNLFKAFMPLGTDMSTGIVKLTDRFAKWSSTLGQSKGFQSFIGYVRKEGPIVLSVLGSMAVVAGKLIDALAPFGGVILNGLRVAFGFLATLSPGQLLAVGEGLTALFLAWKVGLIAVKVATLEQITTMGVLNVVMDANPIGLVVIAIAALAAGLIYAYKHVKWFHDAVDAAFTFLQVTVKFVVGFIRQHWALILPLILGPMGLVVVGVIKHWDEIKQVISFAWTKVIKPTFKNMADGARTLRDAFKTVVGNLGTIWAGLKALFAAPVNWIIKNVINKLIDAVNSVAKKLGHSGNLIEPFGLINTTGAKGAAANPGGKNAQAKNALRTGGVLPGYTPGRDVHTFHSATAGSLHLSGGEAVMVPEWTRAVGGPAAVARMNKAARSRQRAYAVGGVVWPTTGHIISTYAGHDGVDINGPGQDYGNPIFAYRAGRITYVGSAHGYGAPAIFEQPNVGPRVVYGHTSAALVHAGQTVRAGQLIGRVGATGNATGPHLHFGVPGGTYAEALALLHGATSGGSGSTIGNILGGVKSLLSGPLSAIKAGLGHVPGGAIGASLAPGAFSTLAGAARSWAGSLASHASPLLGPVGAYLLSKVTGGSPQATAQGMLGNYGWSASQFGPLNSLWTRESGWNPRARNPSSGAYGIPQALPASKMGSAGADWLTNPATQIRWGLGYIRDRYGSPAKAWAHETSAGWYDQGGYIPPGVSTVFNGTGRPEPVFTSGQWDDIRRAGGRAGDGSGLRPIHVTMPATSTPEAAADAAGQRIAAQLDAVGV